MQSFTGRYENLQNIKEQFFSAFADSRSLFEVNDFSFILALCNLAIAFKCQLIISNRKLLQPPLV